MKSITKKLADAGFACLFTLFLTGCAGLGGYSEPPKVSVADIQVVEVKALEAAFLVQLRVINPNDRPLEVEGVDCSLDVDGRRFADGITGEVVSVPAYGSELVPVTVYSSVFDMVGTVIGYLRHGPGSTTAAKPLEYRLSGNLRLRNSGLLKRIPFKTTGEFSFEDLYRDS